MGQYDFSYELPENFQEQLIRHCQLNEYPDIAQRLKRCTLDYEDVGLAYYAGLKGDNWDKKALDFTIGASENDTSYLKLKRKVLESIIQKLLRPSKTGFLLRTIDFIVVDSDFEVVLPEEQGETFETLSRDIHDALNKNEPTLVLDRLHTYSTKYLREICQKHGIGITDSSGNHYALHSLVGGLVKYYKTHNMFKSDFAEQSLKMSISTFEKYNDIRNKKSYAHDNDVLDKAEAAYVVAIVTATLTFINSIEENDSENWESLF
mgnify:CR=1 FL=1